MLVNQKYLGINPTFTIIAQKLTGFEVTPTLVKSQFYLHSILLQSSRHGPSLYIKHRDFYFQMIFLSARTAFISAVAENKHFMPGLTHPWQY